MNDADLSILVDDLTIACRNEQDAHDRAGRHAAHVIAHVIRTTVPGASVIWIDETDQDLSGGLVICSVGNARGDVINDDPSMLPWTPPQAHQAERWDLDQLMLTLDNANGSVWEEALVSDPDGRNRRLDLTKLERL